MKTPLNARLIALIAAAALMLAAGKSMAAGCGGCCPGDNDKKTTTTAAAAHCETMVAEVATDDPVKVGKTDKAADAKKTVTRNAVPYPLDTCPVTGQKLGKMGKPYAYDYKGREVQFCCAGCVKPFEKEAVKFLKQMDAAIIKKTKPAYPLTTCVVTGDKLGGDMGEPVDIVYKNQLVRFCCAGCVKGFQKDPAKYLKMIDEAKKKAAATKKAGAAK